jgi:hypothetical protein
VRNAECEVRSENIRVQDPGARIRSEGSEEQVRILKLYLLCFLKVEAEITAE